MLCRLIFYIFFLVFKLCVGSIILLRMRTKQFRGILTPWIVVRSLSNFSCLSSSNCTICDDVDHWIPYIDGNFRRYRSVSVNDFRSITSRNARCNMFRIRGLCRCRQVVSVTSFSSTFSGRIDRLTGHGSLRVWNAGREGFGIPISICAMSLFSHYYNKYHLDQYNCVTVINRNVSALYSIRKSDRFKLLTICRGTRSIIAVRCEIVLLLCQMRLPRFRVVWMSSIFLEVAE